MVAAQAPPPPMDTLDVQPKGVLGRVDTETSGIGTFLLSGPSMMHVEAARPLRIRAENRKLYELELALYTTRDPLVVAVDFS